MENPAPHSGENENPLGTGSKIIAESHHTERQPPGCVEAHLLSAIGFGRGAIYLGTALASRLKLNPGCFCVERNNISAPFDVEWLTGDRCQRLDSGRRSTAQAGHRRELGCRGEANTQRSSGGIELYAFKLAGVKREPCTKRSHVDAHAKGIKRRDSYGRAFAWRLPPKLSQPNSGWLTM